MLKIMNNMEESTMSFPVINLVRTGENIKRIAKENGYSADKIRDVLGISDRSNIYNSVEGCPPPIGGGEQTLLSGG